MNARILRRVARSLTVTGIILVVYAFYGPAWNDADEGPLLLGGLLACYVAMTLRGKQ